MKKLLPALATTLAIAAGGAGLYVAQKPGGFHGAGKLAAADYLPSQTLVLFALPDPGRTLENWKTTDLYKIWAEPQVQAFLAKPLSKIPADSKWESTRAQVAALDPKSLFVAVTAVDEGDSHPHFIGGFQFKGPKENVESLLADPKKQYRDAHPAGKADLIDYQGHAIETFVAPDHDELAAVYLGDWYLVANDTALLKSTIDRVDHRTPAAGPALSEEADFQAVCGKLPSAYETLIFARPKPFLDRLYAMAIASGQTMDASTRAESDKVKAVGATSGIESGKIRDVLYIFAPGLKQDTAHLGMTSLSLTSPETLFYLASVIQWPAKLDLPENGGGSPVGMAVLQKLFGDMEARGITQETVSKSLGTEAGLQLTWPAASLQPCILASVDLHDHEEAQKLVEKFTAEPLGDAPWQPKTEGGHTYYVLHQTVSSMLQPTLTLTDKHLILGLDAPQVREAVQREAGSAAATFTASETYKAAALLVDKPNVLYAYLDTRGLFERTYGLLRPYAILGTAFLPAQSTEYIDLMKLPDTETISKHLTPSVLSQTLDKDGTKLDSIGSVTFAHEAVAIGGVVSAVTFSYFAKDRLTSLIPGNLLKSLNGSPAVSPSPAPDDAPTPDGTPAASPKSSPATGE